MKPRRLRAPMPRPRFELACTCVVSEHYPMSPCPVAIELWNRVAVANKNLERTRKLALAWGDKPLTTWHSFWPRRLKWRESVYEYRHKRWRQHFQGQVR